MSIWTIYYFNERTKSEIFSWPIGVLADYRRLLDLMEQYGADLRLPHSRAMGDGLFEIRCRGSEGIGRVFYGMMIGKRLIVLHSFIKKTQETPDKEIKKARKRLKEVKERG